MVTFTRIPGVRHFMQCVGDIETHSTGLAIFHEDHSIYPPRVTIDLILPLESLRDALELKWAADSIVSDFKNGSVKAVKIEEEGSHDYL